MEKDSQPPPPQYAENPQPYMVHQSQPYTQHQPQPYMQHFPVVTAAPVINVNPPVGPTSTSLVCPSCHHNIQTKLQYEPSTRTHLIALALCVFTACCCCLPYCIDSCQNANHYCPNCGAYVGTFNQG